MRLRLLVRLLCPPLVLLGLVHCASRAPRPERPPDDRSSIHYYVRVEDPARSGFAITLAADRIRGDSLDFVLPTWTPGRYGLGVGRTVIENFTAEDGQGRHVPARRLDATSWRLYQEGERYVTISYEVVTGPASEPLPFRAQLDLRSGHALGANLFGTLLGYETRPVSVSFDLPQGWRVVAPLRSGGANRYTAPRYGDLPGTPFVLGQRMRQYKLFEQGRNHEIAVSGAGSGFVPDSLLRLIQETIEHGSRFYGSPPYERYLFFIRFVEPGTVGLGSTGQAAGSTFFLPRIDPRRLRAAGLGRVLLHQYLHAWYPGSFGPSDLVRPPLRSPPGAEDLWFVEGSAEYYARLLPVRFGSAGRETFYESIEELLTRWYELGGGDRVDPRALTRSARRSADESMTTRLLLAGTLATFLIDLTVREETRGLRGLDQAIYYLKKGSPRDGYSPDETWSEVAGALGVPREVLGPLTGEVAMSIEAGLARAGLRAETRTGRRTTLGASLLVGSGGRFVVSDIEPGGTAASAGLREGDRVLKIGPTPISPDELVATRFALNTYIRDARTGTPVIFEIERDGQVRTQRGEVRNSRVTRVDLKEDPVPTPVASLVRSSLFRPTVPVPGDQ